MSCGQQYKRQHRHTVKREITFSLESLRKIFCRSLLIFFFRRVDWLRFTLFSFTFRMITQLRRKCVRNCSEKEIFPVFFSSYRSTRHRRMFPQKVPSGKKSSSLVNKHLIDIHKRQTNQTNLMFCSNHVAVMTSYLAILSLWCIFFRKKRKIYVFEVTLFFPITLKSHEIWPIWLLNSLFVCLATHLDTFGKS